jgi:hypothetical protein
MAIPVPPLHFGRDTQGYCSYAPDPSTVKYAATLTAGLPASVVVPSTFAVWVVSFRYYPNDVWVDTSGVAAIIPAGATLAATTSELNPASLTLLAGTNISMITALATADVSVVMWPVSYP